MNRRPSRLALNGRLALTFATIVAAFLLPSIAGSGRVYGPQAGGIVLVGVLLLAGVVCFYVDRVRHRPRQ